jgi:glycerate kinase
VPSATTSTGPPKHPKVAKVVDAFYRIAERFGVPVVILAAVLWWAKTDLVQPLLNAHFSFIERIVEGQEEHRKQVEDLGHKLDKLIELSK